MNLNYNDMEPATEALGILKTVIDTMEKKCEMIKSELDNATTTKEQITVIEKLRKELIQFKENIQKTKPNFFDSRCYKRIKYILGTAIFTVLTPFTGGLSILGVVGCISGIATSPTADVVKTDAIKSIDNQLKNCDMIIKYLKEHKNGTIAEEGVLKNYIANKKHNHQMRQEARQVKKDYRQFKRDNGGTSYTRTSKFRKLNESITQEELLKKYPTQAKLLLRVSSELKSEFIDVLKGTRVGVDVSKLGLTYNDKLMTVTISVDEEDVNNMLNNDAYGRESKYDDILSDLVAAFAVIKRKYKNTDCNFSIDPDVFMTVCIDIRIQDSDAASMENFILFCDNYQ